MRKQTFFSLGALNQTIAELFARLPRRRLTRVVVTVATLASVMNGWRTGGNAPCPRFWRLLRDLQSFRATRRLKFRSFGRRCNPWLAYGFGGSSLRAKRDPKSADQVISLTEQLVSRDKLTTLMVTHSMHQATSLGDRLIMMHRGSVIHDFRGAQKRRLRIADLMSHFEEVRRAEQLDESAAEMIRAAYV